MSQYKGRSVRNKSYLRKEQRMIATFQKLIANQSQDKTFLELVDKAKEQYGVKDNKEE